MAKVRVKQLEWERMPSGMRAAKAFESYYLVNPAANAWIGVGYYEWRSADDPYAAAQADYERRILSAIEIEED